MAFFLSLRFRPDDALKKRGQPKVEDGLETMREEKRTAATPRRGECGTLPVLSDSSMYVCLSFTLLSSNWTVNGDQSRAACRKKRKCDSVGSHTCLHRYVHTYVCTQTRRDVLTRAMTGNDHLLNPDEEVRSLYCQFILVASGRVARGGNKGTRPVLIEETLNLWLVSIPLFSARSSSSSRRLFVLARHLSCLRTTLAN